MTATDADRAKAAGLCDSPATHRTHRTHTVAALDARQSDELREALAREAGSHAFRWVQQHPSWLARCSCRGWEEPITDEDQATAIHRRWRLHAADALLPVVTAWHEKAAEAQARARAAEEARKTADAWQWKAWFDMPLLVTERIGAAQYVTDWLRDRAAALAADDRTDPA